MNSEKRVVVKWYITFLVSKLHNFCLKDPIAKGGSKKIIVINYRFSVLKMTAQIKQTDLKNLSPQKRNGAEIYSKDCQNLTVWFGVGILGGFLQISRPPYKFEVWIDMQILPHSLLIKCRWENFNNFCTFQYLQDLHPENWMEFLPCGHLKEVHTQYAFILHILVFEYFLFITAED